MCVWALCLLTEWKWVHAFRHFIFWLQLRLHCTQMLTCRGFSTSIINASDRSVTTKPAGFWPSPRTVIFSNKWPLLHCPTASPLLPTGGVECVSGCFASNTSLLQLIKTVRCRLNYAVIVAADLHFNKGFPGPAERAKLIFFFCQAAEFSSSCFSKAQKWSCRLLHTTSSTTNYPDLSCGPI